MKYKIPTKKEFENALIIRHTAAVQEKLNSARVAVAGLGGLGSNIAISLARAGVGHILLIDFDTVDITNLNRQQYMIKHLGMPKADALFSIIKEINPYLDVAAEKIKVTKKNAPALFADFPVICEAFDSAEQKAMLIDSIAENCPDKIIISASGMAGYGGSNGIITRKIADNLYLCGDGVTDSAAANGLMAPRVMLCAAHQANMAIKLIIEKDVD